MSVVLEAIKENLQRNLHIQKLYSKNMQNLRKGSVTVKIINGNEYYYLVYREGEKVKTDYIGVKGKTELDSIKKELKLRENYRKQILQLKKEEKELRKAIKALSHNFS